MPLIIGALLIALLIYSGSKKCTEFFGVRKAYKYHEEEIPQKLSAMDELKSCKEMLDRNEITEEEYDRKKKELLGL